MQWLIVLMDAARRLVAAMVVRATPEDMLLAVVLLVLMVVTGVGVTALAVILDTVGSPVVGPIPTGSVDAGSN